MPTERRKKIAADLCAIIEGLIKVDVKFILVDGLAAVVQGVPVTTMDVNIVSLKKLPFCNSPFSEKHDLYKSNHR